MLGLGIHGLDNFWDKSPTRFLEILKLPSFCSGYFEILKNALGHFVQNYLPKHVITSKYMSECQVVGNKAKGRISKRVFQENKASEFF